MLSAKHSSVQQALEWLEKNQDKTMDEIKADEPEDEAGVNVDATEGADARSLVCNECGKKFRSQNAAEFHASKSGHVDFAESTEEIAPLTDAEKKAKLDELRERAKARKAEQANVDKEERKANEQIRRKATVESQDIKEELQKKQQIKEAQDKKREKDADLAAKRSVMAKIEADKKERLRKAEEEKAKRAGIAPPTPVVEPSAPPQPPKSSASYTEARLRFQVRGQQPVQKTVPAETTLFEVASQVGEELGMEVSSFQITFPRKTFDRTDFGMTVKEAGWVPSAALLVS